MMKRQTGTIEEPFSVTSREVIDTYNNLVWEVRENKVAEELKKVEREQREKEKVLLEKADVCGVPMIMSIRDHMGGLKGEEVKKLTIAQVQNPEVMKAVMCTMDSIFYSSPYDVGSVYLNNRIRMYINKLREVGDERSFLANFKDAKDMFVVKVGAGPDDGNLLHELVVGIYGTNELRQHIPNFAYIYGGFKCSPPLVDSGTGEVITWCLHDCDPVNYVLYENIEPSINMSDYIKTCTGNQFVNVYMQIIYALRLALKIKDFTHYDLNCENVVVRYHQSNKTFQIPYETAKGVEYITTECIPTITNYKFSHVKINKDGIEQRQGKSGFIPFSVYPYRSWIMHDLYKFLMYCLMAGIKHNNTSVIFEAGKIFRFFNTSEDPAVAINYQQPVYFSFPLTEKTNKLSIDDLAFHVRNVCDCSFISTKPTKTPILNCETMCFTLDKIYEKLGISPNAPLGIPDNIIEFYDISIRLQNEGRDSEKIAISKSFNYQSAIQAHINKMKSFNSELINIRQSLKLVDVTKMTLDQLLQYNTMMIVRSMYVSVSRIIDRSLELRFFNEIGLAVSRSYNDQKSISIINTIMEQFRRDIRPSLEDSKEILTNNHNYLNSVQSYPLVATSIQKDPRLKWYWDGRNIFDVVFGRVASISDDPKISDSPFAVTAPTINY